MQPFLRPVSIGLILGIISLFFGIFWAVNLTVNHEKIHKRLNESAASVIKDKFVLNSEGGHDHSMHTQSSGVHDHSDAAADHDHSTHNHDMSSGSHNEEAMSSGAATEEAAHEHKGHGSPWMEAAHERLGRGHLHAMGLGLLSICISLVLSFLKTPVTVKTFASACVGIGGFFYPLAWIIMGFRTPALGIEGAQESVFPIAVFSVFLIVLGVLVTLFYLIKGVIRKD